MALFFGDYFARASKRSGAWMTAFRDQQKLDGEVRPIIVNVMNFAKPARRRAGLAQLDEARTLFHEFGHALHGMLSNVTYPTAVGHIGRDRLRRTALAALRALAAAAGSAAALARHVETGEPIPHALIDKVLAARPSTRASRRSNMRPRRSSISTCTCWRTRATSTSTRSNASNSRGSACRARSSCGTARRISRTSSRARAMRPATTAISGRKCWMRTPSRPSPRRATFSIRTWREATRLHLFGRQSARPKGGLYGVPRTVAERRSAA